MAVTERQSTLRILAGALALGLFACLPALSSPAGAAQILSHGNSPPPARPAERGSSRVVSETPSHPAADGFWTREKMLAAKPAEARPSAFLDVPSLGDATVSAADGDFTPADVTAYPQRIHGRIFFQSGASYYSCSGTAVESRTQNVVFTAGHCVFDQSTGQFVRNLVFVPGYANGGTTLGKTYNATRLFTTMRWQRDGSLSYDLGVVQLDQPVQADLGARQIAFDLKPSGRSMTVYGYPSKPSPPFDGETLQGCRSKVQIRDKNEQKPMPLGAGPCHMEQGASGGGWVTLGNYLDGVTSYSYCEPVPRLCGLIFGPYFSSAAKALYVQAGGSPAPTVKVKRAPPRVVRKRKVAFAFDGTAATLLGFSCRLDRQPRVDCSSRITIARLSPGRHVLRVRAKDQTGRMSARVIVRRFRVIPPR